MKKLILFITALFFLQNVLFAQFIKNGKYHYKKEIQGKYGSYKIPIEIDLLEMNIDTTDIYSIIAIDINEITRKTQIILILIIANYQKYLKKHLIILK